MRHARSAILAATLAALLASPALAQRAGPSQEQLKERRAEKVKEAWFVDGGWIDDYDAARAKAKEEGKLIFAYFTRTYTP